MEFLSLSKKKRNELLQINLNHKGTKKVLYVTQMTLIQTLTLEFGCGIRLQEYEE